MRIGIMIILTRPLILRTASAYLQRPSEHTNLEFGIQEFSQIG